MFVHYKTTLNNSPFGHVGCVQHPSVGVTESTHMIGSFGQ